MVPSYRRTGPKEGQMRVALFHDCWGGVVQELYLYRLVRRLTESGLAGTGPEATEEVPARRPRRVLREKFESCKAHGRPRPGEREPRRAAAVEAPQAICFYRLPEAMERSIIPRASAGGAVLQLDICFYIFQRVGDGDLHAARDAAG